MAKVIRMRAQISGTRDGVQWPKPGDTIKVSDEEAALLIKFGQAEDPDGKPAPKVDDSGNEIATATDAPEKATARRGRRPVKSEGK